MTTTDKRFISRLFHKLDQKIDDKFGVLDQKIDRTSDNLRDELMTEIRHNGVLLERSNHNIEILAEGHSALAEQIGRLQADMTEVKAKTDLIPVLWTVVKDHGRRIAVLEKR